MISTARRCIQVVVPVPLAQHFDYWAPSNAPLQPGMRVEVPFGSRTLVGLIWQVDQAPSGLTERIRPIQRVLDKTPLLDPSLLKLAAQLARYYHHPLGEVVATLLPTLLRQGEPAEAIGRYIWRLTATGRFVEPSTLSRAPRQQQALSLLREYPHGAATEMLTAFGISRAILASLEKKGWAELARLEPETPTTASLLGELPPSASPEQDAAIRALHNAQGFIPFLLDGITGSGNTEVYLQPIVPTLEAGKQALILVPEIGLTPQTVRRFEKRFNVPVVSLHSGLNDRERLHNWVEAHSGRARIILGTRSALFTPLPNPGLIIVDECHDASFKQQDGLRYSARDVAVWRAQSLNIPVLLGSATPSLETLQLARQGRYRHLQLTQRAGNARPPQLALVDCRTLNGQTPLSAKSLAALQATLDAGQQALVFLNRRGYAPLIQCLDCGWQADCPHCSVHYTWHRNSARLTCHHCGHSTRPPRHCPSCQSTHLGDIGTGTEKLEQFLSQHLKKAPVLRIDRDTTRLKGSLQAVLERAHSGEPCVLVGTQMLAKGHHFPNLTTTIILEADTGFLSADFRGPEHAGQLILQVAGRTGRGQLPGQVLIQSRQPEHALWQPLLSGSYHQLADAILQEREQLGLPPFGHLALLRAESPRADDARQLLTDISQDSASSTAVQLFGPAPAPLERRQNRFRFQLMLLSGERYPLHQRIHLLNERLLQHPLCRKVRWHWDVDPLDML